MGTDNIAASNTCLQIPGVRCKYFHTAVNIIHYRNRRKNSTQVSQEEEEPSEHASLRATMVVPRSHWRKKHVERDKTKWKW